ncbi:MAG: AAA family ATPase [Planctomycetales bacterium]|nr:AAA family ATPase [Planctomycetales bacterium]
MTPLPFLRLNRLRVMRQGHAVYDQTFHEGVNIIRGENGSGKSTIADFIFYILGGEYEEWKEAARHCEEVQAEIETSRGTLTLRRDISTKLTPIKVFFGALDEATVRALDGWETFPIRRQENRESFSQVLFRSLLIPEAQSEGASNITMHQIMRLVYSDQRTPSTRLFRFEPFDTQNIREAVGDLICGISGYELYEINLNLRTLDGEYEVVSRRLSSLIEGLPINDQLISPDIIHSTITKLLTEKETISIEIESVDTLVDQNQTRHFLKQRQAAHEVLVKEKRKMVALEASINTLELELAELGEFIQFLDEAVKKVGLAERAQLAVGSIEFTQCPACLSELKSSDDPHKCNVCGSPTDPSSDKSKYNQIRLDLEIQMRESKQLVAEKDISLSKGAQRLRRLTRDYTQTLSEFSIQFDLSTSPREAFLASKNRRIGQIDQELRYLSGMMETAEEIQRLSAQKAELQATISKLRDRREALTIHANKRRSVALNSISGFAASLLRNDLDRQEEFKNAQTVRLSFVDDAMFVDGKMNFAESSNVFLKNSAILGMYLAAGQDQQFCHPRFLLLDNIEDKGMEVARSHLFQRLIVERVTDLKVMSQIIFTTSMLNPELDLEDYVIGPHYTHENRTLEIDVG